MSQEVTHEHEHTPLPGLYENWFLDYASYVILERAVPALNDGLKPVQRRILHAMKEMDDGRFNKVANIIGQTMQYHPHGDAAIGEALVNMGQKDLLIDTQGNWGDIRTGDSAAAPRYIEARLSKFALEVAFNPQTTQWQLSYDGRKKEPVLLPIKFPLVIAQGVEGIAVGLSTKVLPHNFIEIAEAAIAYLQKKPFQLFPDFQTGGYIDISQYNDGARGGKVRIRATIEVQEKKYLLIKNIPFGTTTTSVIESIVKANENNKIKIKKVVDNTAKDVEIQIQLAPNVSPDITIDALYAFTQCEVSISPNACVIEDEKPNFTNISDILKRNVEQTKALLKLELEIKLHELNEDWHLSSLEKIFIENRIYRDIEECETWEAVIATIDLGLSPYKPLLKRAVTKEDIVRLTEIKIKRISKFDSFKADEYIKGLEDQLAETLHQLAHLNDYTIQYYKNLLKKYSKGKERKTEIKTFDTIDIAHVAVANEKLYVNRVEGFVGYNMKKDEYIGDCSDIDDIIVFRRDGKYTISKVSEKAFFGKDIIHVAVFRKNEERLIYNVLYTDGKDGITYAKRFNVSGVTRDKEYDLTKGNKLSKIQYFSANPNSESEIVTLTLSPMCKAKVKVFDYDFAEIGIKNRSSQGNIATKYPVKRVILKTKGASTLGGRDLWFDHITGRLNTDQRGIYVGNFDGNDKILILFKSGEYEITGYDLSQRFEAEQLYTIEKLNQEKIITAVYYHGANKRLMVKRFLIETTTEGKRFMFIAEDKGSKLWFVSTQPSPQVLIAQGVKKDQEELLYNLDEWVEVKGWKAQGNKLTEKPVVHVIPYETPALQQTGPTLEVGNTIEFDIKKERESGQLGIFD